MDTYPPRPSRLGLVMKPADIAAIDRIAAIEEISRATWARKVLRQKLRDLAATAEPAA